MARQSIVDKALVDAEILFFMNDLEGVSSVPNRFYEARILQPELVSEGGGDVRRTPHPAGKATESHGIPRPANSSGQQFRYDVTVLDNKVICLH